MPVAALSTAGFSEYIAASSNVSASQQAWQSLQQGLAAGNLTTAQTAFNTFQQLNQSEPSSSSGSALPASQLSTDMTALGNAIGSGDLSTAQQAFTTLQSALQTTPSQSITNAESAVAQTVQWVDDLLNLSDASSSSSTPADPTTAILDSLYGLNTSTNSADPTTALLENAYGAGSTGSDAGASSDASTASSSTVLGSGNAGSGASVNVYA